jgi:hypothetical protein
MPTPEWTIQCQSDSLSQNLRLCHSFPFFIKMIEIRFVIILAYMVNIIITIHFSKTK